MLQCRHITRKIGSFREAFYVNFNENENQNQN